ncbi:MAG: hypothetical protein AB1756_02685 [Acidobacteriota bacterium]
MIPLLLLVSISSLGYGKSREEFILDAVDLIRNGCFQDAEESLKKLTIIEPNRPVGHFLISFSQFIHLIYNSENKEKISEFEKNLNRTISLAEKSLKRESGEKETRLILGTSYLLQSYYLALRREALSAAFLAKKGKKILENLLQEDPEIYDALFGLGIYNYYADRVPSIVKGIRFLLFLPGGDHVRGIQQLQLAAERARHFDVESTLILAEIYSNKFENDHSSAYVELSRCANRNENLLVKHALAKLHMRILNFEKAVPLLNEIIVKAEAKQADQDVIELMTLHLIRCYLSMGRADKALPCFENLFSQNADLARRDDILYLAAMALLLSGDAGQIEKFKGSIPDMKRKLENVSKQSPPEKKLYIYRKNIEALVKADRAEMDASMEILSRMIEEDDGDLMSRLRLGELFLKELRAKEAFDLFQEILISKEDSSSEILEIAELRAGQALDLMQKRSLAEEFYHRIIAKRNSTALEAAYFYLKIPFGNDPR